MPDIYYHQQLALHNFTAFSDVALNFTPGINALVGENGTGKTHLLKALYAFQLAVARDKDIRDLLLDLFQIDKVNDLVRQGTGEQTVAQVEGSTVDGTWANAIHPGGSVALNYHTPAPPRPIFIPSIDMMGHTKGFVQAASEVVLDFDLTCTDLVSLFGLKRRNGNRTPIVLENISELLEGQLEYGESSGRFYLVRAQGRIPMPLVAEGLRKIATLVRLAQNGWLTPGTTLFWDEPEVNLNPKLMDEVVGAILGLARQGIQVFLATHSYVILKEIDLQTQQSDSVRYFGFKK